MMPFALSTARPAAACLGLLLASVSLASGVSAQSGPVPVEDTLQPLDPGGASGFGVAVACRNGTTIVGWPEKSPSGIGGVGAAYLFDTVTGTQLAKLLPHDIGPSLHFGASVAIDADTALVGAPHGGFSGGLGGAYLFDITTGAEIAKLEPEDGANDKKYGGAVAIDGTTAVIGAHQDGDNGLFSGSAYVFDVSSGSQLVKLLPADGAARDEFGRAVALDGTTVLVGAPRNVHAGVSSGAAYLFDAQSGTQLAKLLPSDGQDGFQFGSSVAIQDGIAVVGAPSSWNGSGAAAYLFDVATGEELAKLLPDGGGEGSLFGNSVAIQDGLVAVGAPGGSPATTGACSVFELGSRARLLELVPYTETGHGFGTSVALDGTTVVIGHPGDFVVALESGSVSRFGPVPSVGFRNAGTNPVSFRSSTAWTGSNLRFTVDLTTTGHSDALVLGFDSPVALTLGGGQTVLCLDLLGGGELLNTGFFPGPIAVFDLPIPENLALLGLEVCTQAVHAFGVSPFALSNAQDLVVSGCPLRREWTRKLLDEGGEPNDQLGTSLAISGGKALLGAHFSDENGVDSGSARLFDVASGASIAELIPLDGAATDHFGVSVAIDGGLAVVGAYLHDGFAASAGAAYLFDSTTAAEMAKLRPQDVASDDYVGWSVAIDGATVVVGAPGDDDKGNQSGSAYLFDAITGSQIAKLRAADGQPADTFGYSVALDDGVVVVGAYLDDDQGQSSGSAYLFDAVTGLQIAKLRAADGLPGDLFGTSVAVRGGIVAVGAPRTLTPPKPNTASIDIPGSVYLFDAASGAQLAKLDSSDLQPWDRFGLTVAMDGPAPTLVVGAPGSRRAYVFDLSTGLQTRSLTPACDAQALLGFASSVAIAGSTILVGAPQDGTLEVQGGSALVFP